jgi:hypothetical protein
LAMCGDHTRLSSPTRLFSAGANISAPDVFHKRSSRRPGITSSTFVINPSVDPSRQLLVDMYDAFLGTRGRRTP